MKYKEWIPLWLHIYIKPTSKIRTYEKYRHIAEKQIIPYFCEKAPEELKPEVLQAFVSELCERFSSNTVNGVINVLQRSLRDAVNYGITKATYGEKICRPRMKEKRVECFSLAEQKKIENAVAKAKPEKMFGILLCLYTGLRIGELLALEWENIDIEKGVLSVDKSCHYGRDYEGNYHRILEEPKTQDSIRLIPLPEKMIVLLKEQKARSSGPFVVSYHGKPVSPRSYQNTFSLLLEHLNIPHRGFHSLRHTFATRALESGMDVRTLSELLGHKNPTTTLHRYCHSMLEHKADMMNQLEKFCKL